MVDRDESELSLILRDFEVSDSLIDCDGFRGLLFIEKVWNSNSFVPRGTDQNLKTLTVGQVRHWSRVELQFVKQKSTLEGPNEDPVSVDSSSEDELSFKLSLKT